jgi:hypothetical protein
MARLIGLGGIAQKIKNIIKKIRKPIDKALNKVIGFVVKKVKKIAGKLFKGKNKEQKSDNKGELDDSEVGKTVSFNAAGKSHKIRIDTDSNKAKVMVASSPMPLDERLNK